VRRLLVGVALGMALAVGAIGLILWAGGVAVVKAYRVPARSMVPAIEPGERVAAIEFFGPVEADRGDIVAYRAPSRAAALCGHTGGVFLHRIVGLPGERVVSRRGRLFVNGSPLPEPYVEGGRRGDLSGSWRVGRGGYFVLGDNRMESCDSRVWGSVPTNNLVAEVVATYWPPSRFTFR
jgi:signal peptidase I